MNRGLKKIILPPYYAALRRLRAVGLLHKPQLKICVSSVRKYAEKTVPLLVESLLANGIDGNDVYVFEGGHETPGYTFTNHHRYTVTHNSFDFTALIEAAQLPVKTDYWFFLHDTCLVDERFKRLVQNIPHFLPQTLPVKNYPSMSMGAYRRDYLASKKSLLQTFRNEKNDAASVLHVKEKAIANEDLLFKQSRRPVVYNGWLLNEDDRYEKPDAAIPVFYTARICEYFPQVGVYKFKANYRLQQARTVEL